MDSTVESQPLTTSSRNKKFARGAKKGYSWYSRLSKAQKIIMWLVGLLVILGFVLGVGLGVGLHKKTGHHHHHDDDDDDGD